MIQNNPTANRRHSTSCIAKDLDVLYAAFIDLRQIKKHISAMQQTLKKSSKADQDVLNNFWQDHASELKKLALENNTSMSRPQ
jgi:t-SNARE complex subunit (syntaxin)